MAKRGHFIVIEGGDGAGKATQVRLLRKKLQIARIPTEVMEFPRYTGNPYGKLISQYLKGEFGDIDEVNTYLISLAYAGDRFLAKPQILNWLKAKYFVIADRYTPSNLAYMAAKMPSENRQTFIDWLDDLEYNINGIPREEIVIYLYVPVKISSENIRKRGSNDSSRIESHDIHERNQKYLQEVESIYLKLAKEEPHWVVINCLNKEGQLRSKEEIHQDIIYSLKDKKIL
jgi:dTMP kinase